MCADHIVRCLTQTSYAVTALARARPLPLDLRLPTRPIFPFPKLHRFRVVEDQPALWINLEIPPSAPRDVAEVAKLRADVALFNLAIQFAVAANRLQKIGHVNFVAAFA